MPPRALRISPPASIHVFPVSGLGPGVTLEELYTMSDQEASLYSDADICAAALANWTSWVYAHFELGLRRVTKLEYNPVTGTAQQVLDYMEYTFTCKYQPPHMCRVRARKRKNTGKWGTKNLGRAAERCDTARGVQAETDNQIIPFTQLAFRVLLILWCAVNHRPFHMLADPLFLMIEQECALHLAIDGWSSPLSASFLGIIVFWRQEGKVWRVILDFIHLTERHTGEYMAQKTIECLERFGITERITSICLDNASNNDTFIRHLMRSGKLPKFYGVQSRIQCIAHIINLIAKAFMAPFSRPATSGNKRQRTAESSNQSVPPPKRITSNDQQPIPTGSSTSLSDSVIPDSHMTSETINDDSEPVLDELDAVADVEADSINEGMDQFDANVAVGALATAISDFMPKYQVEFSAGVLREAQDIIPKISGFAHQVHLKDNLYQLFKGMVETCKDLINPKVKKEVPTKRVTTRWNSDFACVETHWELQAPIQSMTGNAANKLSQYQLSPTQWTWLDWLRKTLPLFKDPTDFFSQKEIPLIHEVLPSLVTLRLRLEFLRDDIHTGIPSIIRPAAYSALDVLNKYMLLLQDSDIFWMAVALCPWYKTRWFADNNFSPECIGRVHCLLADTYTRYKTAASSTPSHPDATHTNGASDSAELLPWMRLSSIAPSATSGSATNIVYESDRLQSYLSMPPISKYEVEQAGGLIQYWARDEEHGSDFARMALDVLTTPASSVDAERAFSGGRMAVNYQQHRMSLEAFRAKMAIGAWYGTPLMEDVDEALDIIKERTSTPELLN